MTRAKTPNQGANDERTAILRKIRDMLSRESNPFARTALDTIRLWVTERKLRTIKKGGLGKQ